MGSGGDDARRRHASAYDLTRHRECGHADLSAETSPGAPVRRIRAAVAGGHGTHAAATRCRRLWSAAMIERMVTGEPIERRPAIDADRSPRDWLLAFVASVPVVLAEQVAELVAIRDDVRADLLGELVSDGLVQAAPRLSRGREAYGVTVDGLRALGSDLPVPVVDLRRYWRDVGVAWLSVGVRRGIFGGEVERLFTEREMRAADRRLARTGVRVGAGWSETVRAKAADASFAVSPEIGEGLSGGSAHYPDVCLVIAQGRVAMQLVLEVPSRAWLSALVEAYARRVNLASTLLLAPSGMREPIAAVIDRAGCSGRVFVQPVRLNLW
jgi:hypothetical protein